MRYTDTLRAAQAKITVGAAAIMMALAQPAAAQKTHGATGTDKQTDSDMLYVSTSFHEPATDGLRFIYSEDGLRWDTIQGTFLRPEVGRQKVMRDPSVVVGPDGTYHMVWTSSWRGDRGFGYSSSKDLIHWTPQRLVEVMDDTTTVNVWAPELFYDDVKRQFLIIWASCIPGKYPDGQEDPKNNHRLYYVTTRDFKKFSKAQLFYEPGFSAIDATLVKLDAPNAEGYQYVMVVKDNTRPERNIKTAFARTPYGPWKAAKDAKGNAWASAPFTDHFTEGPSTLKAPDGSGYYYIYYDSYGTHTYGMHRTKDFVRFQNQAGEIKVPAGHKHGTIFRAPRKIVEGLKGYNRDVVHYTGRDFANSIHHHGGLRPTVGVHNIQVMRGERPWTYNHQPFLAYYGGRYYMSYLSDPRSEHEAPGKTLIVSSPDGYNWSKPVDLFPEYKVPDGFSKPSLPGIVAKDLKAIMHQRVGFYEYKEGLSNGDRYKNGDKNRKNSNETVLVAMGHYCVALTPKDDPNDGNAIGRVARRIMPDGSMGPIYFIYYNHGFGPQNTDYPNYKKSKDKAFVRAVDALLADPMQRLQWSEEVDRQDDLLQQAKPYKAFCAYTLPDGRKAALWKHALTSLSTDGGQTWRRPVYRAPGFVNSNAKIWGQRLSDGTYATVYNPSEYRWPLAISLSADGLEYTTLSLVNGEVTPLRHGGNYKSFGPQYTRGVQECNTQPADGNLWICYSNNKEDIWTGRIAVPVRTAASAHAHDDFGSAASLADLTEWNIYSPLWAPVALDGRWLTLSDRDPYDYAKVERVVPASRELTVCFDLRAGQTDHGRLDIEFADEKGNVCAKMVMDAGENGNGLMRVKGGARYGTMLKSYEAGRTYRVEARLSCDKHMGTYYVDGKKVCTRMFDVPVESICRVIFRTGQEFAQVNNECPADTYTDMPRADEQDAQATWAIAAVESKSGTSDNIDGRGLALATGAGSVLNYNDFAHYAQKFNTMEDENIVTDISNAHSSEWMAQNVPLFDCPSEQMREMYYYRWWSLRKHIKRTPAGYGMTEFLVKRSYADLYNLIACAVGHHIMEMRWARDTTYLHQIVRTWYYGNGGQAMNKMKKFSSWNPMALYEAWKVSGDTAFTLSLLPRLTEEYLRWQDTHRLTGGAADGLYWIDDVSDGMEESISGGRKKQYARPTINSYMYGNARALSALYALQGNKTERLRFDMEADAQRTLVLGKLWNASRQFFETMRGDTLCQAREAIGYMPWYVKMPLEPEHAAAWLQTTDAKGFSAPFGLTTAERRHPQFRSHGSGKCEWDGAIWPFATSQTLTAMANYLDDSAQPVITDSVFFRQMELYVESQYRRGRPYIGEYLDETTGAWLMGDRERSRYYNHSTFADLVITGLVGLRPESANVVRLNPLVPQGQWRFFCLDGIRYHGHTLTIVWDEDGQRYHMGRGLMVMVDGVLKTSQEKLGRMTVEL